MKINELKEYARSRSIPIMQDEGIEFISDYITKNNILSVLEIGSAVGYSAITMSLLNKDIKVTTIERDVVRYKEALKNIHEFNLDNQIEIINGDALEIEIVGSYDLIFIDAAKSQYIKFFNKYKNNLKENGVIISDNLSFHGIVEDPTKTSNRNTRQLVGKIKRYIEFLETNEEFNTTFYKLGDGISVSKRC